MKGKDEKLPEIKLNKWSAIAGALCVAAWFVAAEWGDTPFDLLSYLERIAVCAFFAFICFVLGFVPVGLASSKKGWFEKLLYILGGLALNGGLIWYIFLK